MLKNKWINNFFLALTNINDDFFASGGVDDCIRIFNWKNGEEIAVIKGNSSSISSLIYCKK